MYVHISEKKNRNNIYFFGMTMLLPKKLTLQFKMIWLQYCAAITKVDIAYKINSKLFVLGFDIVIVGLELEFNSIRCHITSKRYTTW